MAKGKLNFKQLVNGSIKCGQLPIIAWATEVSVLALNPKPKHLEALGGDTGCDSHNFNGVAHAGPNRLPQTDRPF